MATHILSLAMSVWASVVPLAHAVDYTIVSPNLPANLAPQGDVAGILVNVYQFGMVIAGVLAFGVIVYAGIRISVSRGNPSVQSDAQDQILQAFFGILLLAGAYVILYTLNPGLTKIQLPQLVPVDSSLTEKTQLPSLTDPSVPTGPAPATAQADADACKTYCKGSYTYDANRDPKCACSATTAPVAPPFTTPPKNNALCTLQGGTCGSDCPEGTIGVKAQYGSDLCSGTDQLCCIKTK